MYLSAAHPLVTPAKSRGPCWRRTSWPRFARTGQLGQESATAERWIPAFAGTTKMGSLLLIAACGGLELICMKMMCLNGWWGVRSGDAHAYRDSLGRTAGEVC